MRSMFVGVLLLLSFNFTQAAEVAGIRFADSLRLGDSELLVNGAGLRKKAFFKVYAMALYLPARQPDAELILAGGGARRVAITLLRDLTAQQFVDALQEGMAGNHSAAEMAVLNERMKQFSDALLALGEAKEGSVVLIDWLPEAGTRLTVNGQVRGKALAGEDFFRGLLKIWLGNRPVQDDLKQALLGKAS